MRRAPKSQTAKLFYTPLTCDIYLRPMSNTQDQLKHKPPKLAPKAILKDFLRSFLVPTLVGKAFVLYFGIRQAEYPGEGYGYGLAASICFTVTTLSLFVWKYRHYEDL